MLNWWVTRNWGIYDVIIQLSQVNRGPSQPFSKSLGQCVIVYSQFVEDAVISESHVIEAGWHEKADVGTSSEQQAHELDWL